MNTCEIKRYPYWKIFFELGAVKTTTTTKSFKKKLRILMNIHSQKEKERPKVNFKEETTLILKFEQRIQERNPENGL